MSRESEQTFFQRRHSYSQQAQKRWSGSIIIREMLMKITMRYHLTHVRMSIIKKTTAGFPGGAVVKNLPANAGDTGSSPGLGRSHMPRSN